MRNTGYLLIVGVLALIGGISVSQAAITVNQTGTNSTVCLYLNSNVSYGQSDVTTQGAVSRLQNFLISQNYIIPNTPLGFFGNITLGAVKAYQLNHSIEATGFVGPLTRAAMQGSNCGALSSATPTSTPTYYNNKVSIEQFSKYHGPAGTVVKIYGGGFDLLQNTVIFGNTAVRAIASTSNEISFIVPTPAPIQSSSPSTYQVYVTNSSGVSNSIAFRIENNNTFTDPPYFSEISEPSKVVVGRPGFWTFVVNDKYTRPLTVSIDWADSGTTSGSNFVQVKHFSAVNGKAVVIASHTYDNAGVYNALFRVYDDDNFQLQDNWQSDPFRVVSSLDSFGDFYLTKVTPSDGPVGTTITLRGNNFSPTGNVVHFGAGAVRNLPSYNNGQTLFFTIPSYINPCDAVVAGNCTAPLIQVSFGDYPIYVVDSFGRQSTTFYVTVTK